MYMCVVTVCMNGSYLDVYGGSDSVYIRVTPVFVCVCYGCVCAYMSTTMVHACRDCVSTTVCI